MIPEWFQMSLRHLATTFFNVGKLKPKYLFKKLFTLSKSKWFIQIKYLFFRNPEYSFKTNIHFFKKKSRIFIQENIHFFKRGRIAVSTPTWKRGRILDTLRYVALLPQINSSPNPENPKFPKNPQNVFADICTPAQPKMEEKEGPE